MSAALRGPAGGQAPDWVTLIRETCAWSDAQKHTVASLGAIRIEHLRELADLIERAESGEANKDKLSQVLELLREAREEGLIYWEPNSTRGYVRRVDMMKRIDDFLSGAQPRVAMIAHVDHRRTSLAAAVTMALAARHEPRGCPTPGACSCPAPVQVGEPVDIRTALETAYRRLGGIPSLARSPGGAGKIIDIAMKEFAALHPSDAYARGWEAAREDALAAIKALQGPEDAGWEEALNAAWSIIRALPLTDEETGR